MTFNFSAERVLDAPADVVYRCIADYQQHHRPGGFLPPEFTDQQVVRGGVGAGTLIRLSLKMGGTTRTMVAEISEPVPGRVLLETGKEVSTTFTVEPVGSQTRVRFDSRFEVSGLSGLLWRVFAPRMLRSVYNDELARLEQYAQAQAAIVV